MEWDQSVRTWWLLMSGISAVNIYFWVRLLRQQGLTPWLLTGGLYVLGCASRCFTPRSDIDRIVMFDNFFSSIFVGRSIATVAELGFVAQWAIVLYLVGKATQSTGVKRIATVIFPMIFVAEIFSWYASITTNTIGSVVEESLWGVVFGLIAAASLLAQPRLRLEYRAVTLAVTAGLVVYVAYMFLVDVPFYYQKWQGDLVAGKAFDPIGVGVEKMLSQWTLSRAEADWRYEFLWQGLYFSVGVWSSLLLNLVPPRLAKLVAS